MDRTFSLLAKTVHQAEDLEQLTRPLLEMLGSVTGMESTYLTTIDLDGFKAINDGHGHHTGDQFLQEISKRMRHALRDSDVIGRLGGDEFVVLGPIHQSDASLSREEHSRHAAQVLQRRLLAAMVGGYDLAGVRLDYEGASIGVVVADPAVVNAQQAIHLADSEMYRVKQGRKASRPQAPKPSQA